MIKISNKFIYVGDKEQFRYYNSKINSMEIKLPAHNKVYYFHAFLKIYGNYLEKLRMEDTSSSRYTFIEYLWDEKADIDNAYHIQIPKQESAFASRHVTFLDEQTFVW